MNAADFDNISSIIDKLEQEAIDVMSTLISINSIGPKNDGPGEQGKADYLIEYLNKSGIRNVKNYPASDPTVENGERPNLVVKINGINIFQFVCSDRLFFRPDTYCLGNRHHKRNRRPRRYTAP